jgi:hypothetical protein
MASLGSDDNRTTSVQRVLKECFWGDYRISEEDILERLKSGDPGFARFLFSKIIENNRHPIYHEKRYSDDLDFFDSDNMMFREDVRIVLDSISRDNIPYNLEVDSRARLTSFILETWSSGPGFFPGMLNVETEWAYSQR